MLLHIGMMERIQHACQRAEPGNLMQYRSKSQHKWQAVIRKHRLCEDNQTIELEPMKMKMKIAAWYNLPNGGGKRALHDHVKGLVERGHEVEIWCPDTADRSYMPLAPYGKEHVLPLGLTLMGNAPGKNRLRPLVRLLGKNRDFCRKQAALDAHCRQVAAQIDAGGFDLLFGNSCKFMAVAPIARYVSIPGVLYLQEPNRHLYEALPRLLWAAPEPSRTRLRLRRRALNFLSDYLYIWDMRQSVRHEFANAAAYDTILVNSYFSRESLLRAYGLKSQVCYLGIDQHQFYGTGEPCEDYVVGLGSFHFAKNVEFAIEAVACVPRPRPRLVWIGNFAVPAYLDAMIALAKDRGVDFEPKVLVTDAELRSYLSRAAMMLYAPMLEPFGYAPLEANACGTPVVATAEGGVRETIADGINGLVVAPEPEAMAAGIAQLRANPGLARQLGEEGRRLVGLKWSLAASSNRLEHHFAATFCKAAHL